MSLYPGAPRLINPNAPPEDQRYELDDKAMEQSMAKAIEDEMQEVFQKVKRTPLPEVGKEDRRLLFVAISRGVLQYLRGHQVTMSTTVPMDGGPPRIGRVDLNVMMDGHLKHNSLRLSPDQIAPGGSSDGTIELSDPAPPGGINVALSSDDAAVATPNLPSVRVDPGQRTAKFKVVAVSRTTPIDVIVNITAAFAGVGQTARLRVLHG